MNITLLMSLTMVLYFMACVTFLHKGQYGFALAYLCYGISNIGIIIQSNQA